MSRTDAHRPWPVQLADPANRHLLYRYQAWPWATEYTSFRNLGCGCRLCTGHHWRRHLRRQHRAEAPRRCRELLAVVRGGDRDDLDVPPPTRWW